MPWQLERYLSSRSKSILAHVSDPSGVSVISAISRSSPCQGHLARAAVDGSQSSWPDGPLCTHDVLLVRLWRWDITSDIQKPSVQAVSGRSGILNQAWHTNEKKRCFPWLSVLLRMSTDAWLILNEVNVWMYFWNVKHFCLRQVDVWLCYFVFLRCSWFILMFQSFLQHHVSQRAF